MTIATAAATEATEATEATGVIEEATAEATEEAIGTTGAAAVRVLLAMAPVRDATMRLTPTPRAATTASASAKPHTLAASDVTTATGATRMLGATDRDTIVRTTADTVVATGTTGNLKIVDVEAVEADDVAIVVMAVALAAAAAAAAVVATGGRSRHLLRTRSANRRPTWRASSLFWSIRVA
jgi:hypothetical protein